jgi:hypothetical protein
LHSKQNQSDLATSTAISSENGDKAQQQHRKNLNPFATEEDDDFENEDENQRDFSIGDLDVEDDGRGLLGGSGEKGEGLGGEDKGKNVNVGIPPASSSSTSTSTTAPLGIGRASFPSMWPFGASTGPSHKNSSSSFAVERGTEGEDENASHFKGDRSSANGNDVQSDESDSSNSSDEEPGYGDRDREGRENEFGGDGQGKRRLSVTTEAKRRTSLEDDDDEDGVVHVGLEVGKEIGGERERGLEGGDDEELVEIQHAEMQGVEGERAVGGK